MADVYLCGNDSDIKADVKLRGANPCAAVSLPPGPIRPRTFTPTPTVTPPRRQGFIIYHVTTRGEGAVVAARTAAHTVDVTATPATITGSWSIEHSLVIFAAASVTAAGSPDPPVDDDLLVLLDLI